MTTVAVPSDSPVDLLYNAQKLDECVSSSALSYLDRFGTPRLSLAGAVARISAVNPRGAWATATLYAARDVVSNSGTWYIALDAHTSGGTFAGDQAAHWRVYQGVLATDLADTTSVGNGDAMVGVKRTLANAAATTQHAVNEARIVDLKADYGATIDGVADDYTALNNANNALAAAGGGIIRWRGTLKINTALVLGTGVVLWGEGKTANNSVRGATCILRGFTGSSPTVTCGNYAQLWDVDVDNDNQGTGECVAIKGYRVSVKGCSTRKSGGVGLRVGATEAGAATFNANLWVVERLTTINNAGSGAVVDHTCTPPAADTTQSATTTSGLKTITLSAPNANIRKGQAVTGTGIAANTLVVSCVGTALVVDTNASGSGTNTLSFSTWPAGVADCNAGRMSDLDSHNNSGSGLEVANAIDCRFDNIVCQANTAKGVWLQRNARGHKFDGIYTESNGTELQLDLGAKYNRLIGNRFTLTTSGWVINDPDNHIEEFDNSLEGLTCVSYKRDETAVLNPASGGEARVSLHAEVGRALYGQIGAKKDSGSGGLLTARTRNNSGVLTDRLTIDQAGLAVLKNSTGGALIGKTAADTTTAGIQIGDSGSGSNTRMNHVGSGSSSDTKHAYYNSNGQVGSIVTNGSATAFNTSSDRRLKTAITDAPAQDDVIDAIRIRQFEFKAAPGVKSIGVIADELQQVVPEAVTGEPDAMERRDVLGADGEVIDVVTTIAPQGVDYSKLVPLLVLEIQALRRRVAALGG